MSTGTSEIIRKIRPFFRAFGEFSAALHKKNITNRRKIIKNRCGTTDFLQRKGAKRLIHEKVGPRKHTNRTRKVYPRNRHEKFIHEKPRIGHEKVGPRNHTNPARKGLSAYLAHLSRVPLHLRFIYSLCTSIPSAHLFPQHIYSLCTSAPTVLRPRNHTNPTRKGLSAKGHESGTKGMFGNECFLHLIN